MKSIEDFTFRNTLDYRAAKVAQQWRIDEGFCTDGISARLQQFLGNRDVVMQSRQKKQDKADMMAKAREESRKRKRDDLPKPEKEATKKPQKSPRSKLAEMPVRGMWAIDELKRVSRLNELHVIGIDPGKRELVVCTDSDDSESKAMRYTSSQRRNDMRTRQYAVESQREKPEDVIRGEREDAKCNSRSENLSTFVQYAASRQGHLTESLTYYSELHHRQRRWKSYIKRQKSEERLYANLAAFKTDDRPLVLAYGAWGLIAGTISPCNRGNPPCIGVGLLRKIAKRFIVALTPEQYTSKTCHKCMGTCGAHKSLRNSQNREIRGLRVCQDESCKSHLNRDANASRNIAMQFKLLFEDKGTIRTLTTEDIERIQHQRCVQCDAD